MPLILFSVFSFVVRRTRGALSLYVALSREVKMSIAALSVVTKLTGHSAAKLDAPQERKLGVPQTCLIPD